MISDRRWGFRLSTPWIGVVFDEAWFHAWAGRLHVNAYHGQERWIFSAKVIA